MQTQNMYELAEHLKQLREEKKNAEQRLKEMNAEIEQADYQLSMLMAETETQNFTRAGTMFALTTKIRASAVAGRKEELYAALKENGCGDLVYCGPRQSCRRRSRCSAPRSGRQSPRPPPRCAPPRSARHRAFCERR